MLRNFGIDYAVKPRMMLVSDINYRFEFEKASFTGLMYQFCPDSKGVEIPYEIAFRLENEPHATQFLDSLISWIENSEGNSDAVSIEFVELKDGGYMIVLSPDMDLVIERMISPHLRDRINPLVTIATQGKKVNVITDSFKKFKEQYVEGRKIVVRYYIQNGGKITQSKNYFLKDKFKFFKEDELQPGSNIALLLTGKEGKQNLIRPPKISLDDPRLIEKRLEDLRFFFPIIYSKIKDEKWLSEVLDRINRTYRNDQIIQSICNLVLFERLRLDNPLGINNTPGINIKVIEHLMEKFESFDSYIPDDKFFTKQKIENQIRLDAKYLKTDINL